MSDAIGPEATVRVPVQLELIQPTGERELLLLEGNRYVIGRSPDAGIRLDHDTVSRHHAELVRDPFERWWLVDLGSRNGVKIDGTRVRETLIRPGESFRIEKFVLTLIPSESGEVAKPARRLSVQYEEQDALAVHSLPQKKGNSIPLPLVSAVLELSPKVLAVRSPQQRLELLCEALVGESFGADTALALRFSATANAEESPEVLCERRTGKGASGPACYISRSVIRNALTTRRPVYGTNDSATPSGVSLTLGNDVLPVAIAACVLSRDKTFVDLLYATLPPDRGSTEWVAAMSCVAELYRRSPADGGSRSERDQGVAAALEPLRRGRADLVNAIKSVSGMSVGFFQVCTRWGGGDFVDVIPESAGSVLAIIGQVRGEGAEAAMRIAGLHGFFRAAALSGSTLEQIMRNADAHVRQFYGKGAAVRAAAARITIATGQFELVGAASPTVAIVSPGRGSRALDTGDLSPLGRRTGAFKIRRTTLADSEFLLLCTDGVLTTRDRAGNPFGKLNLLKTLEGSAPRAVSLQQAADLAGKRLAEHRDGCLPVADSTLLLLRSERST
jgi:hypothetical protein